MLLLRKVEELTLHLIKQNTEIENLNKLGRIQQAEIENLKKGIK